MHHVAGAEEDEDHQQAAPSLRPKLTGHEYFSNPSVEMMATLSERGLSRIDNFQVGRHGVGTIMWPGLTDVRRLNLDEIIKIEASGEPGGPSVTIYPNEQDKAPKGKGLNKEAVIRLTVKLQQQFGAQQLARAQARLRDLTEQAGHMFISFDGEEWIFKVPNFGAPSLAS